MQPQDARDEGRDILVLDATAETRDALSGWLDPAHFALSFARCPKDPTELTNISHRLVVLELRAGERYGADLILAAADNGQRLGGAPVILLVPEGGHPDATALFLAGARDGIWMPLRRGEVIARLWYHRREPRRDRRRLSRASALRLLAELTQSLTAADAVADALYTVTQRLADALSVDRISVVLVPDAGGDTGYVVASSDDVSLTRQAIALPEYPEIRHVLDHHRSLSIPDVETHPLVRELSERIRAAGHGAICLVPLRFREGSLGVLSLRSAEARAIPVGPELDLCRAVAHAIAGVLQQAERASTAARPLPDATTAASERQLATMKRYADLLTSSVDGVVAFDAAGRLIFGNPGAYAILGYTEDTVLPGLPLGKVVASISRKDVRGWLRGFPRGRYPRNVDVTVKHRDGRILIVNGSFSALQGTRGAVLFSFRDVTEERRTEEELVKTRNFLQSLVNASVDAIVAADMDGNIILFNDGAQGLYGYTEEEGLGLNVRSLYPGDGAREVMRLLRSDLLGGYGRLEPVRMEAVDSTGDIFPISLTSAFIYEDGEPTASFGIFTDLREKIRVEEQLAQAQEQLAMGERQSLLAELAGATAHELNQPLTSIMGSAELLQRRLDNPDKARMSAEVILKEAQRMADIVRKIGQLTEYETKSYVGEQRIINLDAHRSSGPPLASSLPPHPPMLPPSRPPSGPPSQPPPSRRPSIPPSLPSKRGPRPRRGRDDGGEGR